MASMNLDEEPIPQARRCDHLGCDNEGLYPAPKSRTNLRVRYYFCLDHVREYNAKWDYFEGFSQEKMYEQMRKDLTGDRPTWPIFDTIRLEKRLSDFLKRWNKGGQTSEPPSTTLSREAQALETLGLPPNATEKTVKTRYRELVKRYHPDKNPDNPKSAERFKIISEAYTVLKSIWQSK
jgi:DnaJ-domain-containing protein 1